MPNQKLIEILIVLDRSGSMDSVKADTIGGFNAFLADQQKLPGEAHLTLVQFDDQYETLRMGALLKDVQPLDDETYQPRGSTALLDAIGRTIDEAGQRFSKMPEPERPGKVVMMIFTDGFENASRKFTRAEVFQKISHQRDNYKWDIVFVGANQDAIAEGGRLGVQASAALNMPHTPAGIRAAMHVNSGHLAQQRMQGMAKGMSNATYGAYTDSERAAVSNAGGQPVTCAACGQQYFADFSNANVSHVCAALKQSQKGGPPAK